MAMFRTSPEKTLQTALSEALGNRDRVATRLAAAQGAVAECRATLQRLAVEGADDAALARGEALLRASQDRVTTLAPALAEKEQHLAKLEAEHAAMIDKKMRASTAAQVAQMAIDVETAAKDFDTATAALAEITGLAARFCPDAVGLNQFAESSRLQVPPASELVVAVMRHYAGQVLRGEQPAALPQPTPVPQKAVQAAPPATRHVFSVRHISWTDPAGLRVQAGGFECDLPPAVAARGLKSGALALIGSEAWRSLKGTRAITHPAPGRCENLDDDGVAELKTAPQPQREATIHSAFQVVDRGPPRQFKIAGAS
jgi:hypothetical protein